MHDWYTWGTLRAEVGQEIGECVVGSVDQGMPSYITDADLIDVDEDPTRYDRAWLLLHNGLTLSSETLQVVRVRRTAEGVRGYDPEFGRLFFGTTLETPPAAGYMYEIHTLIDPRVLDDLMNRALRRVTKLCEGTITLTDNTYQYNLTTTGDYGFISSPQEVRAVYYNYKPIDGQEQRIPVPWWKVSIQPVEGDPGNMWAYLHIRPTTGADSITVQVISNYSQSHTAWQNGTYLPVEWAKAAIEYEVYRYLAAHQPAQDAKRYTTLAKDAGLRCQGWARAEAPRIPRPITLPDQVVIA